MTNKKNSLDYLQECLEQLQNASRWLERSYQQCAGFGLDEKLTDEQFDSLENLSSRFARVTDMLFNKTYRALDLARTLKDIRNE
ncbi:MAG: hypothetical protein LAT66_01250, partial [Alkalimonas sp.]|nr:hypothetical protein [Alkalimonas sp.]